MAHNPSASGWSYNSLSAPLLVLRLQVLAVALTAGLILGVSCQDSASAAQPRGDNYYSGRVTDQRAKPVAKARIEVNGNESFSDANGNFGVDLPQAKRFILNISHPDFAELSYLSRTPLSGQTWRLRY